MIQFACSRCGKKFEVSESVAGKRASCSNCGTVFRVPTQSVHDLLVYDDMDLFSNHELSMLYESFVDENDDIIIQHRISDGEKGKFAILEIATPGFRSQLVYLMLIEVREEPWLGFWSHVGQVTYEREAITALQQVPTFSRISLSLDDDNWLQVSTIRKLENFDSDEFRDSIIEIAAVADSAERAIFGTDKL